MAASGSCPGGTRELGAQRLHLQHVQGPSSGMNREWRRWQAHYRESSTAADHRLDHSHPRISPFFVNERESRALGTSVQQFSRVDDERVELLIGPLRSSEEGLHGGSVFV